MRISTDARTKDIEPAVNWISGLIGAALDKRVAAFERQERSNPLLIGHFRENFALEFALAKARKYRKMRGRLPKGEEYDRLYSFLIPAYRIHAALPPDAKPAFEGRLRYAVNSAHGARSFAYEISIATHLMQKNWDVEFMDYLGLARFDFLARQGGNEVEVECKTTSGDTGRIASTVAAAAQQKVSASNDVARVDYMFDNLGSWPSQGGTRRQWLFLNSDSVSKIRTYCSMVA
jgi:hypothetical protein